MKLRIEKPVYGGAGLARSDGKAVFVPLALPGETVEAAIRRDKGSFAEAELLEVLEPAPERMDAPCPYYGPCGGCQYQHAAYPAQLAMKRAILEETLARAGLRELPPIATHAAEPWGYRNRIRLHVDPRGGGLGYLRRGSHALLPVEACPIAAPLLADALGTLRRVLGEQAAGAWCAEVELFTNQDSSSLLLSLGARAGVRAGGEELDRMCAAVQEAVPELRGAILFGPAEARAGRTGRTGRKALADEPEGEAAEGRTVATWRDAGLEYRVGGDTYLVSAGSFFQGNRFLVETLLRLVTAGAHGGIAWDLYAGVGLFARALGRGFERVVAVEGAPASSGDLRHNFLGPGSSAIRSSTLGFLRARPRERPDLLVLDPPRAGLGKEASALLAQIGPRDITYVSCDPPTLSRDLRVLADAGYAITELDLVDMFPQTFHMETVAKLRRG